MKALLAGVLTIALTAGAATAQDWDYGESRETGRVAMVGYDEGTAVVVQCRADELKVLIRGLPPVGQRPRAFNATRADGRTDQQMWLAGPTPGTIYSTVPGRDARFLRGGGRYEVRAPATEDGQPPVTAIFDLPTEWGNLDRVLRGCNRPVEAPRDRLPRVPNVFVAMGEGEARADGRPPWSPPAEADLYAETSCIVRDMILRDCRMEGVRTSERDLPRLVRMQLEGGRLRGEADPSLDGRVFYMGTIALREAP